MHIIKQSIKGVFTVANYNEIRSLSEKELADALYRVAVSMGQSEKKARETALRAREIKAILSRASDKELEKIVKSIGKERLVAI